jgi:hypothetical protein
LIELEDLADRPAEKECAIEVTPEMVQAGAEEIWRFFYD